MESMIKKVGSWLFLIGICVALLVGLIFGIGQTTNANLTNLETPLGIIVAVLGFIVGILSFFALGAVTQEKVPTFLIASLILIGLAIAVSSTTWIFGSFRELSTPVYKHHTVSRHLCRTCCHYIGYSLSLGCSKNQRTNKVEGINSSFFF